MDPEKFFRGNGPLVGDDSGVQAIEDVGHVAGVHGQTAAVKASSRLRPGLFRLDLTDVFLIHVSLMDIQHGRFYGLFLTGAMAVKPGQLSPGPLAGSYFHGKPLQTAVLIHRQGHLFS